MLEKGVTHKIHCIKAFIKITHTNHTYQSTSDFTKLCSTSNGHHIRPKTRRPCANWDMCSTPRSATTPTYVRCLKYAHPHMHHIRLERSRTLSSSHHHPDVEVANFKRSTVQVSRRQAIHAHSVSGGMGFSRSHPNFPTVATE